MNRNRSAKAIVAEVMVSCALGLAIIGCAAAPTNPGLATAPSTSAANTAPPDVNDCARITSSSPTRYQCGDKTYSSYDLTKLQHDAVQQNAAH